jgi:hypothetical protein
MNRAPRLAGRPFLGAVLAPLSVAANKEPVFANFRPLTAAGFCVKWSRAKVADNVAEMRRHATSKTVCQGCARKKGGGFRVLVR